MFLNRIELFGFKSFADKINIEFGDGVFCIVGPNGCGKSNIVDAVRWALGERSSNSVRGGGSMADLIFKGNGRRGPLNFAEVTLVFDNQSGKLPISFSEVAVTRRVNRDGEGDYYINRENVRLKDIHNLFMDTGVNRDLYSLIGQGEVNRLAESSSLDRRQVFEEAAGIRKYHAKRLIAMRNLDETSKDLTRLSDILGAKEDELKRLYRQSRKAQRAKAVYEEFRTALLATIKDELDKLDEETQTRQYQRNELLKRDAALRVEKEELLRTLTELRQKEMDSEHEVDRLRAGFESRRGKRYQLESDVKVARNRADDLEEQQTQAQRDAARFREKQGQLEEKLQSAHAALAAARDELGREEERQRQLKRREDELTELLGAVRETVAQQSDRLENLKEHTRTREQQGSLLQERQREKEKTLSEVQKNLLKVSSHLETTELKGTELRQTCERLRGVRDESARQLQLLQERREELDGRQRDLRQEIRRLEQEVTETKAELTAQQKLAQNYAGCQDGVRNILGASAAGELAGLRGILAERITLDKRFEVAIEAALGENLQAVVADDADSVWTAVDWLQGGARGRVTLVWPQAAGHHRINPPVGDGIYGRAVDLLDVAGHEKTTIYNLLERVLVVENVKTARELRGSSVTRGWDMVTLRGDYWHARGALTAGPLDSNQLLGRNRIIGELRDALREKSTVLNRQQSELQRLEDDAATLRLSHQRQQDRNKRLFGEVLQSEGDLHAFEQLRARIVEEHEELEQRQQLISEELSLLREQLDVLLQPDEETAKGMAQLLMERRRLELREQEVAAELTTVREEAEQQRERVFTCRSEGEQSQRELELFEESQAELLNDFQGKQAEMDSFSERREALRCEIAELQEGLQEQLRQEAAAEEAFNLATDRQHQFKNLLQDQNGRLEVIHDAQGTLQEEFHKLETEAREQAHEIDTVRQRYVLEFNASDEELDHALAGTAPARLAEERLEKLHRSFQRHRNADFDAIDEYNALQQWVEFHQRHREDLLQARANLLSTVRRIDRESRKRFKNTFEAINNNFRIIARRLFEGGEAWLELVDDDNILKAGVEIYLRPPGKKKMALMQYSGGERALLSLALLFSVFLVKPSPFCILDEVDAPLDDSNINRFLNLVREFSCRTQFIFITHSKKTMMKADKLIGVTMEESGVSKVLELSLAEVKSM